MAKAQILTWGIDDAPSSSVTQYQSVTGNGEVATWTSTESEVKMAIPTAGTLTNMWGVASVGAGTSKTLQVAVRQNGTTTSLSLPFTGTTTQLSSMHRLAVADGDLVNLVSVPTSSPTVGTYYGAMEFRPDNPVESIVLGGSGDATLALSARYLCPSALANPAATYSDVYNVITEVNGGTYGFIKKLRVTLNIAPGGVASRTFTIYKNGATTGISTTITGTATSNYVDCDIELIDGDTYALYATASGAPTASAVYYGMVIDATDKSQYMISGVTSSGLPTSVGQYQYNRISTGNSTWTTVKADRNLMGGLYNHHIICVGLKTSRGPGLAASGKAYEVYVESPSAAGDRAYVFETATYAKSTMMGWGAKRFSTWNVRALGYNTPLSATGAWTIVMKYTETGSPNIYSTN